MQNSQKLSRLRRELRAISNATAEDVGPFLSDSRLRKGTVYTLRRKCSKPSCRCARGQRHESVVLTASVSGKTKLWTISKEDIETIRQQTECYRQFRKSRFALAKRLAHRQAEMLRIIDAIERIRTETP